MRCRRAIVLAHSWTICRTRYSTPRHARRIDGALSLWFCSTASRCTYLRSLPFVTGRRGTGDSNSRPYAYSNGYKDRARCVGRPGVAGSAPTEHLQTRADNTPMVSSTCLYFRILGVLGLLADSWLSGCGWTSRPQLSSIPCAHRLGRAVSRDLSLADPPRRRVPGAGKFLAGSRQAAASLQCCKS